MARARAREEGVATAGLALAAALALLAARPLPAAGPAGSEPVPCAQPARLAAVSPGGVPVGCGGGPALRGPERLLFGLRLDANRAEPGALEALPGIGPARAAAIAAERCRRPFASLAELERVPGIGPRTRAALQPWLEVADPDQARCGALQ